MTPLDKIRVAHFLSSGKNLTGRNPYSGFCPSHHDRKRSLSVTEDEEGKILLHCHTGCDTERDVLGAWGMGFKDLFPQVVAHIPSGTIYNVEKEITVDTEAKASKHLDLYEQTKAWVNGLPEDYSDLSRDEFKEGWKGGWIQVLREWDSVVSLVENRLKKNTHLDIGPIIFVACLASAAAYRTRNGGSWDAGKAKLVTYAREWASIPAIAEEISNQLNDGGSAGWEKVLDPDLIEGIPVEGVVEIDVPPPIPTADRVCLMCGDDISHRRLDALFCGDVHRRDYRRQQDHAPEDANDMLVVLVSRLSPLGADSSEEQCEERRMLEQSARAIERLRARVKRLEDLATTERGFAHVQEAVSINARRHLEHRHLMKSQYEEGLRRPIAREYDDDEGDGQ